MTKDDKLKPCTICGGTGEDIATPPVECADVVRCAECGAETAGHEPGTGGHIAAWNRGEICPPQVSVFPSERFPAPLLAWEPVHADGGEIRGYLITQPQVTLFCWQSDKLTGSFLTDAESADGESLTFPEARDRAEEALREWVRLHGRTLVLHVEAEAHAEAQSRGEQAEG